MIAARVWISAFFAVAASISAAASAQEAETEAPEPVIEAPREDPEDAEISARIDRIFDEIDNLSAVEATTVAGVVTLSGVVATAAAGERAVDIASRVEGVVAVENRIERDVSVETRLSPAVQNLEQLVAKTLRGAPLFLTALLVFLLVAAIGLLLARWEALWRRVAPNAFIGELMQSTTRIVFLGLALVVALTLLDATAFLGAVLGAAGVLGLAVGFAVRDPIENYITSIMLSLRQPFRPNDHVVIGGHEGRVVRLTSRATILLTLDGNHLRIPNAAVFKSVILNYTTNPERRVEFELGVDADEDPLEAASVGRDRLAAEPFALADPDASAHIREVGDSSVIIVFQVWIDQRRSDYFKSRTAAIAAVKSAIEAAGFTLPEPIYRLRIDSRSAPVVAAAASASAPDRRKVAADQRETPATTVDTAPERHIEEKVNAERRVAKEDDLLNESAPSE